MADVADGVRNRAWCFTINNWVEEDWVRCEELCKAKVGSEACRYLVICAEAGESGTPHIQGYVEFISARRAGALKKHFVNKAHLEIRRGTSSQAADYCKKTWDDNPKPRHFEFGTPSCQGRRTDLDILGESIVDGASNREIAIEAPGMFIKYHKGIQALRAAVMLDRDPDKPPQVMWRWGLAGVGKTRFVHDSHKSVYTKDSTQWWDGYYQQDAIVIDDFDASKWSFRDLLRLLDRYAYQGQVKGAYVPINSPFIYVTCEFPPEHFWHGNDLAQIRRRLTSVTEVMAPEPIIHGLAQKTGRDTDVVSASGAVV